MSGITRRDSLKSAIAAFCAAPIAKLQAENGGHINPTRFTDMVVGEDIDTDIAAALPAAERLALKVIASYGALSSDDGFYKAAQKFADEYFGLDDALEKLKTATGAIEPHLPEDEHEAFLLVDAIHCAAGDIEHARWEAMWLLGVCVGVRLGGGR
jgi:hypothetical protein